MSKRSIANIEEEISREHRKKRKKKKEKLKMKNIKGNAI